MSKRWAMSSPSKSASSSTAPDRKHRQRHEASPRRSERADRVRDASREPMTEYDRGEPLPAWQLDELISEVSFYRERWSLRVQAHLADQPYGRSAAAGLIPLAASQGVCTAVDARAYILIPEISLDVSLRPSPRATDAIGTVEASRWHGMKPAYVGAA